jgi:P-type Ca2+ transporter type 2C
MRFFAVREDGGRLKQFRKNSMVLSEKDIQSLKGLTDEQVYQRLQADGYNELPSSQKRGILKIALEVFKEPMFLLLVACGAVYLIMGNKGEAMMLLGFVFVVMGITIYQEGKTEKAIEALRDLSSPRALVIREGIQKRIAGREVVKGDIIILREGDRIPADAVLLWGLNLSADESLLTGESVPVRKTPADNIDPALRKPGGDDLPFLFSGCLVVQGQAIAEVVETGPNTEIGKIGKVLHNIKEEPTLLQKETGKVVKNFFIIAMVLCLIVVIMYKVTKGEWLPGILSGITLAMAILPEEFPVVLTIFLALGAWRISKSGVLTRKAAAVEILGSATVLCVDKTGTLTQNRMSVRKIFTENEFLDVRGDKDFVLPEKFHEIVEFAILASKKDPFDPMEKALRELGHNTLYNTEHLHNWPLVEEYPLSREVMALSHVWETPDGLGYLVSAKGAPEAISDLCHLREDERKEIAGRVNLMASEGLRVLGVAKAFFKKQTLPPSQHDFDFHFIGLIGLADPVRETVPAAIAECYNAGIRVVMITGDYPVTACNIAKQIGLKNSDIVITGPELEKASVDQLAERLRSVNVFSRVVPEQKLLIVNALKANGEIVAMTGDGVNDAPALKASHIGVSMGERGTDVARESSDLVLLNDNFASLVTAVRMGRRIFDNLKKATAYIISVHVPIAGASLLPVVLDWPIILFPVHVVFLELIIDPACSVVFETEQEEPDIMNRPPRDPKKTLFSRRSLLLSFVQGIFSLLVVTAVFKIALSQGQTEAGARTLAFITLVISNLCLILTNRSWARSIIATLFVFNKALVWVTAGAVTFLCIVIYVPLLRNLFRFELMHLPDLLICLVAGVLSIVWFELVKYFSNKKQTALIKT